MADSKPMEVYRPPDSADFLHGDMPRYPDGQWTMAGSTSNVNAYEPFMDYYDLDAEEQAGAPGPGEYDGLDDSGY